MNIILVIVAFVTAFFAGATTNENVEESCQRALTRFKSTVFNIYIPKELNLSVRELSKKYGVLAERVWIDYDSQENEYIVLDLAVAKETAEQIQEEIDHLKNGG